MEYWSRGGSLRPPERSSAKIGHRSSHRLSPNGGLPVKTPTLQNGFWRMKKMFTDNRCVREHGDEVERLGSWEATPSPPGTGGVSAHSPRLTAHGSRPPAHGTQSPVRNRPPTLSALGPRKHTITSLQIHSPNETAHGPRSTTNESRLTTHHSRLTTHDSTTRRLTTHGHLPSTINHQPSSQKGPILASGFQTLSITESFRTVG